MNRIKLLVASMLAALTFTASAANISDHWWSPAESGWGVGVTQQDNVAFIAMFVYGSDGQPLWLTGQTTRYGTDAHGNPGFSGPLYRTTGPAYGGAFDPKLVDARQVGTVTFESTGVDSAVLFYVVDGVAVTKAVRRFTFANKYWGGIYRAAIRTSYRNCPGTDIPAVVHDDGLLDVEHDGSHFRMWVEGKKATCMYTGTYEQQGRLGSATGSYTCADGPSGTFRLSGLETNDMAFAARIDVTHPACGAAWQEVAGLSLN